MPAPEPNGGDGKFGRRALDRLEYEAVTDVMQVMQRHVLRLPSESLWHATFVNIHRELAGVAARCMPREVVDEWEEGR
jgi:hypothetical protein